MKRLNNYLRLYRCRHGLTERDLALLIGYSSSAVISRLEKGKRRPRLRQYLALHILFGADAAELFPAYFAEVEEGVMRRAFELDEHLKKETTAKANAQRALLKEALRRATTRPHNL